MTEYLVLGGGTLAHEVTGASAPVVGLAHGTGTSRGAILVCLGPVRA